MNVTSAIELVNNVVYKPDWKITATDHTNRFEGAVTVRIDYPARATERAEAAEGYPREIMTYAIFPMIVIDCDDVSLYRKLLSKIMEIEEHEAREFLRVLPTFWAPFHPHRVDGMRRWGHLESDLQFGIA
jgi:hypothetical protein